MSKKPTDSDSYVRALQAADRGDVSLAYDFLLHASSKGDVRARYAIATWLLNGKTGIVDVDETAGVTLLKSLEDSNVAEALYDLAIAYDLGRGVRKNSKRAFSLYMRAGLLGSAAASDQVSQFFGEGKVIMYDAKLRDAWAERSKQLEKDISPAFRVRLRP